MFGESDESKNDHHIVITSYLDNDIIQEKMFLPISVILTTFFLIQKLNDNLMTKWQATFYPIYIFIIFSFIKFFIRIVKTETSDENEFDKENENDTRMIKIRNIKRIILISNFFSLINFGLAFLMVYYIGEFLDKREDESVFITLYMLASICVSQIIYSVLRKTNLFVIGRKVEVAGSHSSIGFISSFTAPLLTYLSNMMIVCSSSSGMCTQIYMSTIASLLGAFGVTISDFSDYLFPITVVLLGVSLFSLYIKKKKLTYKPFLLGVFSSIIIIVAHLYHDTNIYYLIYPGNILMIVAAIWNARLNKFYGLPKYNK